MEQPLPAPVSLRRGAGDTHTPSLSRGEGVVRSCVVCEDLYRSWENLRMVKQQRDAGK